MEAFIISRIEVQQNRRATFSLQVGQAPEAIFSLGADSLSLRAYCNLHGLWKIVYGQENGKGSGKQPTLSCIPHISTWRWLDTFTLWIWMALRVGAAGDGGVDACKTFFAFLVDRQVRLFWGYPSSSIWLKSLGKVFEEAYAHEKKNRDD